MIRKLIASVLLVVSFAAAHPADNLCSFYKNDPKYVQWVFGGMVGGQISREGVEICVHPIENYGFHNFQFFSEAREYWHERRKLNDYTMQLAECRIEVEVRKRNYSMRDGIAFRDGGHMVTKDQGRFQFNLDYWQIIPADPVREIGGNMMKHVRMAENQIGISSALRKKKVAAAYAAGITLVKAQIKAAQDHTDLVVIPLLQYCRSLL